MKPEPDPSPKNSGLTHLLVSLHYRLSRYLHTWLLTPHRQNLSIKLFLQICADTMVIVCDFTEVLYCYWKKAFD
jgi:hypothetical protein